MLAIRMHLLPRSGRGWVFMVRSYSNTRPKSHLETQKRNFFSAITPLKMVFIRLRLNCFAAEPKTHKYQIFKCTCRARIESKNVIKPWTLADDLLGDSAK